MFVFMFSAPQDVADDDRTWTMRYLLSKGVINQSDYDAWQQLERSQAKYAREFNCYDFVTMGTDSTIARYSADKQEMIHRRMEEATALAQGNRVRDRSRSRYDSDASATPRRDAKADLLDACIAEAVNDARKNAKPIEQEAAYDAVVILDWPDSVRGSWLSAAPSADGPPTSRFAATNGLTDEVDDTLKIRALAAELLSRWNAATISGSVTLTGIDHDYDKIIGQVVDGIDGRSVGFNVSAAGSHRRPGSAASVLLRVRR